MTALRSEHASNSCFAPEPPPAGVGLLSEPALKIGVPRVQLPPAVELLSPGRLATIYAAAFGAALLSVGLHGSPQGFLFSALLAGTVSLALAHPLYSAAALIVIRPVTEANNASLATGVGSGFTLQRWWGLLFLLCLLRLAYRWRSEHTRTAVRVVVLVAVVGAPGALTGPVGSVAVTRWFWVVLAVMTLFVGREAARRIPLMAIASIIVASAVVTIFLVLIDPYGHTGDVALTYGAVSELSAGYVSPHTLAFAALALLAWTIALAFAAQETWLKAGAATLSIGLVVIIVLTTIRAAQLGLVVLLVFAAAAAARRRGWDLGQRQTKLAIGGVVALLIVAAVAIPSVRHRWLDVYQASEGKGIQFAGSGRGYLWHQAFLDFRELSAGHKLVGSGLGAAAILTKTRTGVPYWAHTDLLELLVSVGVVGTIVVLALVVALGFWLARARDALRDRGADWLWLLAIGSALAFVPVALLVGYLTYASATIVSLALVGYVAGLADAPVTATHASERRATFSSRMRWHVAAIGLGACFVVLVIGLASTAFYVWGA